MKIKLFALSCLLLINSAHADDEVRLAVYKSFSVPKELIQEFENDHQTKVSIIQVGGSNETLNKLIISKAHPIADAVYGLDNANIAKAQSAGILAEKQPQSVPTKVQLPHALAMDYGYITLNYDKQWFEKNQMALPKSLNDLTLPQYKNLLVMPNANTSSVGQGFVFANIATLGEPKAFEFWAKLRQNGVKITKGWSEAYNTEFSLNGGSRPLMVGYASSPAAEVYYSKGKLTEPNMGNLFLAGGVFRQIEGAAVLQGGKQPQLAGKLLQFLQSEKVQNAIPTAMWVYPANSKAQLPDIMKHAQEPSTHSSPSNSDMAKHSKNWLSRWSKIVLR